ncbi:MAG: DNA polymerase ligase N-terminal domain-containing protein [Solirubrobacteraceae bacterium]
MADRLRRYRDKRDPSKTEGPGLRGAHSREQQPRKAAPRFGIQKHAASSLHYDFRLEVDGTLRSWAVPKSLSTDPRVKRLAVEVEDHPLEYADFEGTIGKGSYGGWTLQRTRKGDKPQWLVIKRRDEQADARRRPESTQPSSVRTGRMVEQVAQEGAGNEGE